MHDDISEDMVGEWAETVKWYSENPQAVARLDPVLRALVESVICEASQMKGSQSTLN